MELAPQFEPWLKARYWRSSRRALTYNVGRSIGRRPGVTAPAVSRRFEALRPATIVVVAVLTGFWLEQDPACDVTRGNHRDPCRHRANRVPYRTTQLAGIAFARTGGSQIEMVHTAIAEAASASTTYIVHGPRNAGIERAHLLSVREHSGGGADHIGEARWDPYVFDDLMKGRFQYLPENLLRGLRRGAGLLLWVRLLMHPKVAGLSPGRAVRLSLNGRKPVIPLQEVGLGGLRPGRVGAAVEEHLIRGNALQRIWRATSYLGAEGQLLVEVRRTGAPGPGHRRASTTRHSKPPTAAVHDVEHVSRSPQARQSTPPTTHEPAVEDNVGDDLQNLRRRSDSGPRSLREAIRYDPATGRRTYAPPSGPGQAGPSDRA